VSEHTPQQYRAMCDWPDDQPFSFRDERGEHDPCYVVMPGGAMLPLNHHNAEGVDIARAKFIIEACNQKLFPATRSLPTEALKAGVVEEMVEVIEELLRCIRGGDETAGISMDDALLDADALLSKLGRSA